MSERDYGLEAHNAAAAHLQECWDYLSYVNGLVETDNVESVGEDPASAPFCGCDTCQIREILWAAWPFVRASIAR